MANKKKPVLADHKRRKKRLVPPLLAAMGQKHSPYSWSREVVPELLWVALIIGELGPGRGVSFANRFVSTAAKICSCEPKPLFAKITSFDCLSDDEKEFLVDEASSFPDYGNAITALAPLFHLLPVSPLDFLKVAHVVPEKSRSENVIYELMPKLYDRRGREAVLTIATCIYTGFEQGKLGFAGEKASSLAKMVMEDFSAIEQYPDTDASRAAGASFRAMVPLFLKLGFDEADDKSEEWLNLFWGQVGEFGECGFPIEVGFEEEPENEQFKLLVRFRNAVREELYDRMELLKFDLNAIEQHEVVGSLVARQVTLAADLAASPNIWTPHIAPILLRAMADVFITLAWIFESPNERATKFIEEGLGAVKLELAHRKAELESSAEPNPDLEATIEYWENWLASQRMAELVEVNLGSWSGTTTREMAREAGCLDFYNDVYQSYSAAVHSQWQNVSDNNTLPCTNPAHRFHRLAVSVDLEPNLHWLVKSAEYLERTFNLFDSKTGTKPTVPSAYDGLIRELDANSSKQSAKT